MTRRIEVVTVMKQTVVEGKVVAAVTNIAKLVVNRKEDGSAFVVLDGKPWPLVDGLVLVTN